MTNRIDVSTESFRVYHYGNGDTFRIDEPRDLFVITDDRGDSHRIVAADGLTYRPERDWTGISWHPREGAPAFVA